ncbi:MAG TPA: hypothetical protein VGY57_03265, partial [Vicinamibacterales bacterium]|nr:hypothetical protein [Vicinamibacterales bacterium]
MPLRIAALAILATFLSPPVNARAPQRGRPARPQLTVPNGTRLMVIAPHPDDEVLGAGGLIQRVHSLGGN